MILQLFLDHAPSSEEVSRRGHRHYLHVHLLAIGSRVAKLPAEGVGQNGRSGATTLVCDGRSRQFSCACMGVYEELKIIKKMLGNGLVCCHIEH